MEGIIPCKLLTATLAFCWWTLGNVSHLVSKQHFLQAENQITDIALETLFIVCPLVLIQALFLANCLAALGTSTYMAFLRCEYEYTSSAHHLH